MADKIPKVQPPRSVRRQLLMDSIPILILLLLAGMILLWQVNRLTRAVQAFQLASQRASAALAVQKDSQELIGKVSQALLDEDSDRFIAEVNAALDTLQGSNARLIALAEQASPRDAAYPFLTGVSGRLESVVGIVETMIRQAEAGQWPSVRIRVGVLNRDQQQLESEIQGLVELTEAIETQASAQTASARQAAVIGPVLVVGLAVLLGAGLILRTARNIASPIETLTAGVMQLAAGNLTQRVDANRDDEFGQLASAFNQMADRIQASRDELEQRVADRTRALQRRALQLQAAAEVGRIVASIRDLDQLLPMICDLISRRFGFYHTGIFLLDEGGEYAVLQAANSDGGRQMLEKGHRLRVGEVGIVGYVTHSAQPRIALDVGQDAYHFKNPFLPMTRSEMALPLSVAGEVVGALDVQSTKPSAFSQEDVEVLQVLADLVAVAIENARLFRENEAALEGVRRAYAQLTRQAWEELLEKEPIAGYEYSDQEGLQPLIRSNLEQQERGLGADGSPDPSRILEIPIHIRDQSIGVVRGAKSAGEWSEEEVRFIHRLTEQLSVALENARLYMDSQRRAERERLVAEITTKIRATNDPKIILQTAVSELRGALRASGAKLNVRGREIHTGSLRPPGNGSPTDKLDG